MLDSTLPLQDCRDDARELLSAAGYPCKRAIGVDRDSIQFLGAGDWPGKPFTAWLHRLRSGQILVYVVHGFAAEEPAGLHMEIGE